MKQLPLIDTTTDTFSAWITKCNSLITLANTEIVTANNSANGAITTGVGYVIGAFGSNTVSCSILAGGNTIATANLTATTNVEFTGTVVKFDTGMTRGANSLALDTVARITTSNTNANQVVDSFSTATYRSAKYVISVTDPVNAHYQSTEIMLLHDGTTTYTTEYATLLSNTSLASFSSAIANGSVQLLVTPVVANVQINVAKTLVAI